MPSVYRSRIQVSVRVGKILSTRRPYSIIGTVGPYDTSVHAVDKGALGRCIAMYTRPELGPAHDRATCRVPLPWVLCQPHDSRSGVLWRGHARARKRPGSFNSHTGCPVRSAYAVRSMSASMFIALFCRIWTANRGQNA